MGEMHSYSIDWTEERIEWSVDGRVVRTIRPGKSHVHPPHTSHIRWVTERVVAQQMRR